MKTEKSRKTKWEDAFTIVSENQDFLVINKKSGISTQANNHYFDSVEQLLIERDHLFSSLPRSGIVHRLDKETSGLLLVAKHTESLQSLSSLFKERQISKVYLSLHQGIIDSQHGEISFYTSKDFSSSRRTQTKVSSWDQGKLVYLRFEVLQRSEGFTLVKVIPLTGRAHQIRLAFQQINFPIFNDQTYNKSKGGILADNYDGQYLHAFSLSFSLHEKSFQFKAELPLFFISMLKRLGFFLDF